VCLIGFEDLWSPKNENSVIIYSTRMTLFPLANAKGRCLVECPSCSFSIKEGLGSRALGISKKYLYFDTIQ